MLKKLIKNTVGIAIGGVGIDQAHNLDEPHGKVVGTAIAGGLTLEVSGSNKKKRGGK